MHIYICLVRMALTKSSVQTSHHLIEAQLGHPVASPFTMSHVMEMSSDTEKTGISKQAVNTDTSLEPTMSYSQGEIYDAEIQNARNGEFERSFSQRQVHVGLDRSHPSCLLLIVLLRLSRSAPTSEVASSSVLEKLSM